MVGAVRIGGHGIPGAEGDPAEFARAHIAFGYGAAYCPPVEANDTARQMAIEKAFADADITIAEVGIWKNLISTDPAERRKNMAFAAERLAVADAVGALCAVSYIGSLAPATDYAPAAENFSREAFDATVDAVRELLDTVKPRRAKFALEMMQYTLPDSVNSYIELIRAIDRPMFGVHVDPVNLITSPRLYWANAALLKECFARLGDWVVSCHAKDIRLQHKAALHFDEVMIGEGVLDYGAYLTEIARLPHEVPLMIEHLEGAQFATARDAIYRAADVMWVDIKNRPPR
jgi:sugar phosphate isomerase/epimerase